MGVEADGSFHSLVRVGRPNSSAFGDGPLDSDSATDASGTRPMYGLSQVFQVAAPTGSAMLTALSLSGVTLSPAFAEGTLS